MSSLRRATIVMLTALTTISPALADEPHPIVLEIYAAFQTGELDRWDAIVHESVVTNSSASFGNVGVDALKRWANEFLVAFAPRIDLVDYINAIDADGNGRAVVTVNLNWQHVAPFFDVLQPTGRTGTSIENLILTVKAGKVTRIEVADTTLDLVIYMHENGWVFPQNIRPEPIVRGIDRPSATPKVSLN